MLPCIPVTISPSIPTSAINLAPQFPSQSSFSTPLRYFTIAASLSLIASSPPNLNRSCTTNPYGWKTHEEILVHQQIPALNPLQPFYPKALSLICHQLHSCLLLFLRAGLLSMATMEARPEAKPEPKEIEESYEPLLKYKILQRRLHGKLLVMESVNVAPSKAMEMRVKVKYTTLNSTCVEGTIEYWGGVGGLVAQESTMHIQLRKRLRHQPMQKLLIRLIADSTTNEHYNFKLDTHFLILNTPPLGLGEAIATFAVMMDATTSLTARLLSPYSYFPSESLHPRNIKYIHQHQFQTNITHYHNQQSTCHSTKILTK
ncbi:hypothetical protein EV2_009426 [Malus domestica]